MKPILLTLKEFEDTFGYSYKELNLNLEKTRDGETCIIYLYIKSLKELKLITTEINKKSFLNGQNSKKGCI